MTTLADIQSRDWSMALDAGDGGGIGAVVQGLDDIAQCIAIILTTPPGTDPLRPTFACDTLGFIDKPADRLQAYAVRTIIQALEQWEPRIRVLAVAVRPATDQSQGHMLIAITWALAVSGSPTPITTTIALGGSNG